MAIVKGANKKIWSCLTLVLLLLSLSSCLKTTQTPEQDTKSNTRLQTANTTESSSTDDWLIPILSEYLSDDSLTSTATAPILTQLIPNSAANSAPKNSSIFTVFDKPAVGLDQSSFVVHRGFDGQQNAADGTYSGNDSTTFIFDPTDNFFPGEDIQITLTNAITDIGGIQAITPHVYKFRAAVTNTFSNALFSESSQAFGSSTSYGVALGDIDNDGDLDAFITNNGANKIYKNSNGLFVDTNQSLGNIGSNDIDLGDLDGDGDLDALVSNRFDFPDQVYINNGSGIYSAGQGLGTSTTFESVLGDLDGDGDLDLVTAAAYNNQSSEVYLNDGNANFTTKQFFDLSFSSNGVDIGDLDGDGDLDIFLANTTGQADSVYLNDGSANFSKKFQAIPLNGTNSNSIKLADLDNDGDLDAFVSNFAQGNRIYENDGSANFIVKTQSPALGSSKSYRTELGDLDGDGDIDAFVPNLGQPDEIFLNDGFANFSLLAQPNWAQSDSSRAVALGDIDGDGDLDAFVAIQNGPNKVAWNGSTTAFTLNSVAPVMNEKSAPANASLEAIFNRAATGANDSAFIIHSGFKGQKKSSDGTFTGDNSTTLFFDPTDDFFAGEKVDVTLTSGISSSGDNLPISPHVHQFIVATTDTGTGGTFQNGEDLGPGTQSSYSADVGDIDGDGDLDIVLGNWPDNTVYKNDDYGQLVDTGQALGGNKVTKSIKLGDLDNDGDLDIIAMNRDNSHNVHLNDGTGTFSGSYTFGGSYNSQDTALGDLNGDGYLDVVVANNSAGNRVYFNNGDATFTFNQSFSSNETTLGIDIGDLDNDGDLDVMIANGGYASGGRSFDKVFLNDGNGNLTEKIQSPPLDFDASSGIALGDLDGDGDLDAFVVRSQSVDYVYINDGTANFSTRNVVSTGTFKSRSVSLGDLDGDGDLDAYIANYTAGDGSVMNNGDGTFTQKLQTPDLGNLSNDEIALGDLDGDGDLDAVVPVIFNSNNPSKIWWNSLFAQYSSSPNVAIPDASFTGAMDTISISETGLLSELEVFIDISHTYMFDLSVFLEHIDTGTSIELINNPLRLGIPSTNCKGDDFKNLLTDNAVLLVQNECNDISTQSSAYTPGVKFIPNQPLSAFTGVTLAGTWQLKIIDVGPGDVGTFNEWTLYMKQ